VLDAARGVLVFHFGTRASPESGASLCYRVLSSNKFEWYVENKGLVAALFNGL